VEERIALWLAQGPIQGVFWLPALDQEPGIDALDLPMWRDLLRVRAKNLYATMRSLGEAVGGPGSFLVAGTRLGGFHGYDEAGATAPMGGAVSGFAKAYKRERGEAVVKVVDLASGSSVEDAAEALLEEARWDPGAVEVGRCDGLRFGIALEERSAADGRVGLELGPDSVFVVTGAAGGITSEIVADLAEASCGTFHLLDLAPEPRRGHRYLALLRVDREALRQTLIDEGRASGARTTPKIIADQMLALEREAAALVAIEAVERAGGRAFYHSVDLRDGAAVEKITASLRERHQGIDVMLHAAGVEISRPLADKSPAEFDLVFDVKADGLFNLLSGLEGLPLRALVAFSSVAGRFGNAGQTDYSAANDLLCKVVSNLRRRRPETRGIVVDWTAWRDIGMASRGSLPQLLQAAGIELLPPEVGVPTIRRELTSGATRGELLVAGELGSLLEPLDATGGLDVARLTKGLSRGQSPFLSVGQVRSAELRSDHTLVVELELDPRKQPFLSDHQVEAGVPYLPGVVGTELFAEVASLLAPGRSVVAVEDLEFVSPIKFHKLRPRALRLYASARLSEGGPELAVQVWLESVIAPPKPGLPPRTERHFAAVIRLSPTPPQVPLWDRSLERWEAETVEGAEIYRTYFHGPAYQVLRSVQVSGEQAIGRMAQTLPPDTAPETSDSLLSPRLIELCFQTAGQWEIATKHRMCLPSKVASTTVYRHPEVGEGIELYALVTAREAGETFDARVVDSEGQVYLDLRDYRTVTLGAVGRGSE
jgi:NAD(P)-dependent dehydrogenase (short-subunit alcohol dehydrogenase family)